MCYRTSCAREPLRRWVALPRVPRTQPARMHHYCRGCPVRHAAEGRRSGQRMPEQVALLRQAIRPEQVNSQLQIDTVPTKERPCWMPVSLSFPWWGAAGPQWGFCIPRPRRPANEDGRVRNRLRQWRDACCRRYNHDHLFWEFASLSISGGSQSQNWSMLMANRNEPRTRIREVAGWEVLYSLERAN